jgi:plasmid maintenance system antidote protein VapI
MLAKFCHRCRAMVAVSQPRLLPSNERLREMVRESGMYHRVIAERAGIRPDVFSGLINGKRTLSWTYVARLAPVLGVPMEAFLAEAGK